jgi:predicted transcriptional regulator
LPLLNLGSHDGSPFTADADRIVTGRTCVIGASGSGKSYLVAVLCEELCKADIPFLIIDTEGEYHTLKEKCNLLWVGDDGRCDIRLNELRLEDLAAAAPESQPIILDLSDSGDQRSVLGTFLTALYAEVSRRRLPYLVVLEEADRFVPQAGERLPVLDEIARRGRKRGLGLVICTQRPSVVDKNVLSQCSNQLMGRLVIRNDLQAVSHFFPGQRLPKQLTTLAPGSFYAMGDLAPEPILVTVRARETSHGGFTPLLSSRPPAPLLPYPRSSTLRGIGPSAEGRERAQAGLTHSEAPGPAGTFGFASRIKPEDVPFLVRRARSYVLFGGREMIVGVQKVLVPIAELAVRSQVGLLKKHYETKYLLIDGRDGRSVEVDDGISFGMGFSQVLGLEQKDIEVLQALEPNGELTVFDLVGRVRLSEDLVRRSLKTLEDRRLAFSYRRGRVKVYRRTVDVPQMKLEPTQAIVEKIDEDGTREPPRAKDEELRQIVRGLVEGGEVDKTSLLYYPLYRVRLELNGKSRIVWIDARTGRQVETAQ